MKILFLAANPHTSSPLRLAGEQREIETMLEKAHQGPKLQLTSVFAARPNDLLVQMNRVRPHILHFSGHGSNSGGLYLENQEGAAKLVSPEALKAVFKAFRPELQVVVLNACHSATQAAAFTEILDAVIAMKDIINDKAAIAFASAFYGALGFGRSIAEAFEQGVTSILLEGASDADVPELMHRSEVDPAILKVATSWTNVFASHPKVPARIQDLLKSGSRLILLDEAQINTDTSVVFELLLRQSSTTYVVQCSRTRSVEDVARELAFEIVPSPMCHHYDWMLVRKVSPGEQLPSFHTLEMAGVASGAQLLLLGNHKLPEWAPSIR